MAMAVHDLSLRPQLVLIDALTIDDCPVPQRSFIKGEWVSASIAAASVVAKYVRDCLMKHYHDLYPAYGFDRHKGYSTRMHLQCIRKFGPCPIHRTSFSPVVTLNLFDGDE
jgi:ribonuclease HII